MKHILTTQDTKCVCKSARQDDGVTIIPASDDVAVLKDCCIETIEFDTGESPKDLSWDSSGAFWQRNNKVFKQVGEEGKAQVLNISNLRLIDWPMPYLIQSPYCDSLAEAVGLDFDDVEEDGWLGMEIILWKKALVVTSPSQAHIFSSGMCSPHPNSNERAGICLGGNLIHGPEGTDAAAPHILEDETGYASPFSDWHFYSTTPTTKATLRVVGDDKSATIFPGDGNPAWPLLVSISRCQIAASMWHSSMPLSDPDRLCGRNMMNEGHHKPRNTCAACPLPCPAKAKWVDNPCDPWVADGLKEIFKSRSNLTKSESAERRRIRSEHSESPERVELMIERLSWSDATLNDNIWLWLGSVYPSAFTEAQRLGVEESFYPAAALLSGLLGLDSPESVFDFHPSYLWGNRQVYKGRNGQDWPARDRRMRGRLPRWAFNMGYPTNLRNRDHTKGAVIETLENLGVGDTEFESVSVYPVDSYAQSGEEYVAELIDAPIKHWMSTSRVYFGVLPSHIKKAVSTANWDESISQTYAECFKEEALGIFTYGVQNPIDPPSEDEDEDEDDVDY